MRRHRRAKIVATLGPSSSDEAIVRALFETGVDVFRLNFSHGTHAEHSARHALVRAVEAEAGRPIGILADLQGPKLRIGTFRGGEAPLAQGQRFTLGLGDEPGDRTCVGVPHAEIFAALAPGAEVLLDDGKVRLRVAACGPDHAETVVVTPGVLSDRKGLNLPGVTLPIDAVTPKDREDLAFALSLGVDWVALSFVQGPDDIASARRLVPDHVAIVAKLEKPAALDCLEEIVELSDAIMVARGDLGVELAPEDVPAAQKRIVHAARTAGKPVVIATQMLDSMMIAPAPTRAEASDVATAVYDGADALMLSGESAAGRYPREAVAMMNRIVEHVERDDAYRRYVHWQQQDPEATTADAITAAARQVADTLDAASIVTYTTSGSTAVRAARERPKAPILVLTPDRGHGAAACARLGRPLRPHRRCHRIHRHGGEGVRPGARCRPRCAGRAHRHHRRRPLRHAGHDQRAQNRSGPAFGREIRDARLTLAHRDFYCATLFMPPAAARANPGEGKG